MRGPGYGGGLRPRLDRQQARNEARNRAAHPVLHVAAGRVVKTGRAACRRRTRSGLGGAQRRLDLFLGHFGTPTRFWICIACEGRGVAGFRRCEECCGAGRFMWSPDGGPEVFVWPR